MGYQIFISYRRNGSEFLGKILYDRLTDKGYSVFYDVEALRSGHFNTQLYEHIDKCTDFLLLLPPHALDRCVEDPEDWVLLEITRAIKTKKNIVPIVMRGFEGFPDKLPAGIASLPEYEYLDASQQEYFDKAFERLCENFLQSRPELSGDDDEYSVTTESRLTETVSYMLRNLNWDSWNIDFFCLFQVFCAFMESRSVNTSKSLLDCYEGVKARSNVSIAFEKPGWEKLIKWYEGLSKSQKSEVNLFFDEVYAINFFYKNNEMSRKIYWKHFIYLSETWDIMDIFKAHGHWIIATKETGALLPEFGIFRVVNGSVMKINRNNSEYTFSLAIYAFSIRLMNMFPEWLLALMTEEDMKNIKEQWGPLSWAIENYIFHCCCKIEGVFEKNGLLFKKKYSVVISPNKTDTLDSNNKLVKSITPFGSQQTMDIIRLESFRQKVDGGTYFVLTCPVTNYEFLVDEPHIYEMSIDHNNNVRYKEFLSKDIFNIPSGIRERFSLRMAVYRTFHVFNLTAQNEAL